MINGKYCLAIIFTVLSVSTPLSAVTAANPPDIGQNPITITWAGCGVSKVAFMSEMVAAYEKKTGVKVVLQGGGAAKGIRRVSNKEVDIGGTCRHTVVDQVTLRDHKEERFVELRPVAWDALVVITHKDNVITNLTMDQLRDVYTGKITNWKSLGGKDAPIDLYVTRGKESGVGYTKRELIFNNYDQDFVAKYVVEETSNVEKGVVSNPNGVGITGISSARKFGPKIHILNLDGMEPSYVNIKNGQYTLYRPLYIVKRLGNYSRDVRKFLAFVSGPEGMQIMRNVGTVPYEDGIRLWSTYLEQQNKAIARRYETDVANLSHGQNLQSKFSKQTSLKKASME